MILTTLLLLLFKCLFYLFLVIAALVRAAIRRWLAALGSGGLMLAAILEAISRH